MARSEMIGTMLARRIGVLVLALFSVGCGDGGGAVVFPEPRKSADDEAEAPADRATAVASAAKAAQVGGEVKKPKTAPKTEQKSEAEVEAFVKRRSARRAASSEDDRPADLAEWTHDDYRTAKLDRDARLVQAVLSLGRSGSKSDEEAKLLLELLAPTEPGGPRGRRSGMGGLGLAVAGALAANHSPVARAAIKQILLGRLESDIDDQTLTLAALGALVSNPAPDTEAVLHVILTAPEAIRPPGRGTLTAEYLQRECAALLQKSASPQLRARLAEHVARDSTPASHRAVLLPMLLEPRVENLKAQTSLGLSASLDATSREAVQRQLGQYSKRILDDLWGVPEAQQLWSGGNLRTAKLALPDAAKSAESFRLADHLWNDAFASALAQRLEDIGTPTAEPELWAVATSIPNSRLRRTSRTILMKHWPEGEAITHAQQFSAANMRDPGMLAVLKSLPREDAWGKPVGREAKKSNAQGARIAKEREVRQAWQIAVRTMVAAMNRRFEYAARVEQLIGQRSTSAVAVPRIESAEDLDQFVGQKTKATQTAIETSDDKASGHSATDIPIQLPGAQVTNVFRRSGRSIWKERSPRPSAPCACIISAPKSRRRPRSYYRRSSGRFAAEHSTALENGRWIESVTRPEPGKLRSIDVSVSRARGGVITVPVSTGGRGPEKLVVEVLWLEIDDFAETGE